MEVGSMSLGMRTDLKFDSSRLTALKRTLSPRHSQRIKIGWWRISTPIHLSTAQVSKLNEEGHINAGWFDGIYTPPRPFIRLGWTPKAISLMKDQSAQMKSVLDGGTSWEDLYKNLSEELQDHMKNTITGWSRSRNKASTIALKGFDDPLIESGTMRDNVKTEIIHFTKRGR